MRSSVPHEHPGVLRGRRDNRPCFSARCCVFVFRLVSASASASASRSPHETTLEALCDLSSFRVTQCHVEKGTLACRSEKSWKNGIARSTATVVRSTATVRKSKQLLDFPNMRNQKNSEVGRVLSTNLEIVFGVPWSVSASCVTCRVVRSCGRETGLQCWGVFRSFLLHVFLFSFSTSSDISCFFRCRAHSSRSLGVVHHSPNLLVIRLAGLCGFLKLFFLHLRTHLLFPACHKVVSLLLASFTRPQLVPMFGRLHYS